MPNTTPKTSQSAFSLLEMLVVITIIGILATILIPTGGRVMTTMRKVQTENLAVDLRNGISTYSGDYNRLPFSDRANGGDLMLTTEESSGLIDVLLSAPGDPDAEKYNPRRTTFINGSHARTPRSRGIVAVGRDFRLNDSWGEPFRVYLDTNQDGHLEVPNPRGSGTITLFQPVAVISTGPDRELGPKDGKRSDDVATY